jgi:hypothetical protein
MENNIKNKLVEFCAKLTPEQTEIINIVSNHATYCDYNSEKEIATSLNKCLESHTYFDNVKELLGLVNGQINENSLYYKIKDLYYKVARKENAFLYENALSMLLDCLNLNTDEDRKIKVVNELQRYTIGQLSPAETYKLYYEFLPKQRQFNKYIKGKKADKYSTELVELLSQHFCVSEKEATEYKA